MDWDLEADVVVIGFGAAGACAALEAAAGGADVLVLDRFGGGGATELSGGIVYAGGGTIQQLAAKVEDTPESMLAYLRCEVGDAVTEETLAQFCVGSADLVAWLVGHGVPFQGSLCPEKTSYPTNRHYLYYSGSELSFADVAPPAPRGHRALGRGTSGRVLYEALKRAVLASGARVMPQTRAVSLVTDSAGRVVGVECQSLRSASAWARFRHRVLHNLGKKPFLYLGGLGRRLHRPVARIEDKRARPMRIGARNGVVIAAGGFVANRTMLREHAPAYRGGLALGTVADDGSGINLGVDAGGATSFLDRVSCWRFITPPSAFLRGIIVDRAGERICDESRYGAAIGDAIVNHDRRGWLLADQPVIDAGRHKLRSSTLWFQLLQARYLLNRARVSADTVEGVAAKAEVDPAGLAATVAAYNSVAAAGERDPLGKPADLLAELKTPPYSLIDLSIRPRPAYPAPMLTLGGLVVDEKTGLVRRQDGSVIDGLHAAGRSAVGLCSNSYVSGLSLADCVFSGRRAGRHAAKVALESEPN
jgi:3-oxo-5alpha-steroid 4-dehydrogenase